MLITLYREFLFSLGKFKEGAILHSEASSHHYPPDIAQVMLGENHTQNYTINIILDAVGWQTFKYSLCPLSHNHLLHNLLVKNVDGKIKPYLVGNLCPQIAEVIKIVVSKCL